LVRTIIITCLAATFALAQEKTTNRQIQHFSHSLVASTKISPLVYSARDVKVLGDLDYEQTSRPVVYSARPRYSAFVFSAFGGETVEVTVHGTDRKAIVALADSSLNRLAIGDTSLRLSLPNRGPYIECWYIVFRDFEKKPACFTVSVKKIGRPAPNPIQTVPAQPVSTHTIATQ
jgi:hypothetical protein